MAADRSTQPTAQAQQPPDCEKCGRRKQQELSELENTEGKQESEETGIRWFSSISVKVQRLFGLNAEQEVNQKDIETTNENEREKKQRYFNICPNVHCEQHLEDRWVLQRWELRNSLESKLTAGIKEKSTRIYMMMLGRIVRSPTISMIYRISNHQNRPQSNRTAQQPQIRLPVPRPMRPRQPPTKRLPGSVIASVSGGQGTGFASGLPNVRTTTLTQPPRNAPTQTRQISNRTRTSPRLTSSRHHSGSTRPIRRLDCRRVRSAKKPTTTTGMLTQEWVRQPANQRISITTARTRYRFTRQL